MEMHECPDSSPPLKRETHVPGKLKEGSRKKFRLVREIWDRQPPKCLKTWEDEGEKEDRGKWGKEKV